MLLLSALAISGCGGGSAAVAADKPSGPPQKGGEMVVGMDQEPPCINTYLVCGGMAAASMMADPMMEPLIDIDNKSQRIPILATEIPTPENGLVKTEGKKMIVSFGLQPNANWSDGKPIVCEDLVFTWKTFMSDKWLIGSRLGWEKLDSIECPDSKHVVWTYKEPYAPYLRMMQVPPLPAHALKGKDFNTYWNDHYTVVSGPFKFKYWKRNVEFVLERNPQYWRKGTESLPRLDTIKFRFLKDTNTLKIQLRTGEVDLITPPPDTTLPQELKTFPRAKFQIVPGGYWEQLAFNTGKPPMDNKHVRKAVAYAVDRQQITDVVLRKQVTPLQSTLLPVAKDYYTEAWKQYTYDEAKIKEHLTAAGYTRSGQYWEKGGKPLQVTFKSTAGNVLRMKVAQLLQQTFKKNGIQMDIVLEEPGVFFGQSAIQGAYNIALWAWSSDLDPTQTTLFACDQIPSKKNQFSGNNNYRYCNKEVSRLLAASDATVPVAERAAMSHKVQQLMADDVPMLPLYQRPETIAYTLEMQDLMNNPIGGQFWNAEDVWVSAR